MKQWQETASVGHGGHGRREGIERARLLGQKYVVMQIIWPEQMATWEPAISSQSLELRW
ncbi:MAG: hypothetical protein U1F35_09995 [Steroidobacteraceae bacterium]